MAMMYKDFKAKRRADEHRADVSVKVSILDADTDYHGGARGAVKVQIQMTGKNPRWTEMMMTQREALHMAAQLQMAVADANVLGISNAD